jgi:hypothetical protein
VSTPSDADVENRSQDSSSDRSQASIGELFADVSRDITLLLRQEVELAKAEGAPVGDSGPARAPACSAVPGSPAT